MVQVSPHGDSEEHEIESERSLSVAASWSAILAPILSFKLRHESGAVARNIHWCGGTIL